MDTTQDTVINGLRKVYTSIAQIKLAPDANQPQNARFLDGLMNAIQQFTIAAGQATIGAGATPSGPVQTPAGPAMAGMGGGGPSPSPLSLLGSPGAPMAAPVPGGGMMGLSPSGNPSSMGEIQRLLTQKANV